jgi:nucleoside-diphosphate-sugar epimerase
MRFTVFGASGFVGSHLVRALKTAGHEVLAPTRAELHDPCWIAGTPLGHAIYAIGLTADFREWPFATADAHVGRLMGLLAHGEYDSFLYLSSARLYGAGAAVPTAEDTPLFLSPVNPDHLYNATKAAGEALVLSCGRPGTRVVRLSNVYGPDFASTNFLFQVLREAANGVIRLRTALASAKDYVSVKDVVHLLPRIATRGRARLYNVASGTRITHGEICNALSLFMGCRVVVEADARICAFPAIEIARVRDEFGFRPRHLLDDLPALVAAFQRERVAA